MPIFALLEIPTGVHFHDLTHGKHIRPSMLVLYVPSRCHNLTRDDKVECPLFFPSLSFFPTGKICASDPLIQQPMPPSGSLHASGVDNYRLLRLLFSSAKTRLIFSTESLPLEYSIFAA